MAAHPGLLLQGRRTRMVVLVVMTAGLTLSTPPAAAAPAIVLSPSCGPAGEPVHLVSVDGSGFRPGAAVVVTVASQDGGVVLRQTWLADFEGDVHALAAVGPGTGTSRVRVEPSPGSSGTSVASSTSGSTGDLRSIVIVGSDGDSGSSRAASSDSGVATGVTRSAEGVEATFSVPCDSTTTTVTIPAVPPPAVPPPATTTPAATTPAVVIPAIFIIPAVNGPAIDPSVAAPAGTTPAAPATTQPTGTVPPPSGPASPTGSADQESTWSGVLALIATAVALLAGVGLWLRRRPPQSPWGTVVWRTARMRLSAPSTSPGSRLVVTVSTRAALRSAQRQPASAARRSRRDKRAAGALVVDVRLLCLSDLAVVEAPGFKSLTVRGRGTRSAAAVFAVIFSPDAPDGSVVRLTALFTHDNRPCGYVFIDLVVHTAPPPSRTTPVMASSLVASVPRARPATTAESVLRIEPGATPPDLLVRVTATQVNDKRSFLCEVMSRFDVGAHEPEPWNLPDTAPRLVEALMDEFTAAEMTPRHRRDTLVGAGTELFDVAPAKFRDTLWRLIDEGRPPHSIFVCTEEPVIPWELMVPYRDSRTGTDYRQPLGVEYSVGRWVGDPAADPRLGNPHQAPLQIGPLVRSVVIAPDYAGGGLELERGPAEVALVMGRFPGIRLTPALYDRIDAGLRAADAGLLHFVGHGRAESRGAHVLVLEKEETLSSTALRGMKGARSFCGRCHPVVFLNGCEVGRLKPGLAGVDGFAKTLIRQGARCVIAPLWSVKDSIAHEVAAEFYEQHARHPDLPLGQVFQTIRRRAYDPERGEDSYAAYAFFGDPMSRAQA